LYLSDVRFVFDNLIVNADGNPDFFETDRNLAVSRKFLSRACQKWTSFFPNQILIFFCLPASDNEYGRTSARLTDSEYFAILCYNRSYDSFKTYTKFI